MSPGSGNLAAGIPLAGAADAALVRLARATGAPAIAALSGAGLLGERAALMEMTIPGAISAGGACRLLPALSDTIALNLARPADRELLPALFEADGLDPYDEQAIAAHVAGGEAMALVARGRSMGLAIAAAHEAHVNRTPTVELITGTPSLAPRQRPPRVLDLSALWAGPLAAHLLWLAGAEVIKVESRARPDAMRHGQPAFHALLNQGKASLVLDLGDRGDIERLRALIAGADIVVEAARPRALAQLGIDVARIVRATPGLVWLTITAYGATGEAADWVGFGDDVGVAGGLSAAMLEAGGRIGFVGDAIADPLAGIHAALAGWEAWAAGRGGLIGVALRDVAAACLAEERERNPAGLAGGLVRWGAALGGPFPHVPRRSVSRLPAFGGARPCWADPPC